MSRKFALAMVLMIFLTGMLIMALKVQRVESSDTIYIMADGSVSPDTAPISSTDNISYTLTGNIIYDKIVVQRNNIIIDGKDFTIEGTEAFDVRGIDLSSRTNITVKNVKITKFYYGIYCFGVGHNFVFENNITSNTYGVHLWGSGHNNISRNDVENNDYGISLSGSGNNDISGNNIANNDYGIWLQSSWDNIIHSNRISGSNTGAWVSGSGNKFYDNEFIDSWLGHASILTGSNIWDDGYPSGGNYWDDFEEKYPTIEDVYSGEFQNETGSDGIWDHPYLVDAEDVDHYPKVPEFPSFLILPLFMIATLLVVIIHGRR